MTTSPTRSPRRHPTRDALRAVGLRTLEGLGTVAGVSASGYQVRISIECCGITVKLHTSVPVAREAAKVGLLSPGDRVLFRARPVGMSGSTIEVGIIEVGSLQAIGEEFCLCGVEEWVGDSARIGETLVQFPASVAAAKPWLLSIRGEDGRLLWGATPGEEAFGSTAQ